jgi:flavodoxin
MISAIVVYSNTGNTRRVVEAVALQLGATLTVPSRMIT